MSKRIVLILVGVIAVALIATAFFWGNSKMARGALAGQSKILVVAANGSGNRDSMPAGGQAAQQLIPVTGSNALLSQPSVSPYLVEGGQPVDDHFPALASTYLTVVGTYHDR